MKCIKFDGDTQSLIVRIPDDKAQAIVKSGEASFVPKAEWKENNNIPRKQSITKERRVK